MTDFLYPVVIESNGVPDVITELISYDPQRLLTDQRSLARKIVDRDFSVEQIAQAFAGGGKLYPHQESIMEAMTRDREYFDLSSTGRYPRSYFPDYASITPEPSRLMRRREPTFVKTEIVHVDLAGIESRILAFHLNDRVSPVMNRLSEQLRRSAQAAYDAAVTKAVFAAYIKMPPRRPMTRSERIEYLMRSKDPRQRKRGARMAKDEFRRVFGDLPSNWNRSTHRMDFGETYEPKQ